MKTSLRPPTKYEAERIEAMLRLGCIACAQLGIPYADVQCHHILDGSVRMGHWFSLGLCAGHHKGEFTFLQRRLLTEVAQERGIKDNPIAAVHTGRKAFAKVYGTEQQLWIKVQTRLKLPAVWPTSKRVPREGVQQHVDRNPDLATLPESPVETAHVLAEASPGSDRASAEGIHAIPAGELP